MTTIPSFESVVLTISGLLAPVELQTAIKQRFQKGEMGHVRHQELLTTLLEDVRRAVEIPKDSDLFNDFLRSAFNLLNTLDTFGNYSRTYDADERQVLWEIAQDLAPAMGRTYGFWSLDQSLTPQLPNGDLWFLPRTCEVNPQRLVLPVETLATWWVGELGTKQGSIWPHSTDDRLRTFQNWKSGKTTPSIDAIYRMFPDKETFLPVTTFASPQDADVERRLEAAIAFLNRSFDHDGIAEKVTWLIECCPRIPRGIAEQAFAGRLGEHEKTLFVTAVETRWGIRRLFLVARALEAAFKRAVATLTPDVPADDPDPFRNKALQLIELFKLSYKWTVDAGNGPFRVHDRRFREAVPEWLANGAFWGIMPHEQGLRRPEAIAHRFSSEFKRKTRGRELDNIFLDRTFSGPALAEEVDTKAVEERDALEKLLEKGVSIWWSNQRNRQSSISELLEIAQSHPRKAEFEADILYLEALHCIAQNDPDTAKAKVQEALDACNSRGFGELKTELAWLGFSLEVAFQSFSVKKAERFFRTWSRNMQPEDVKRFFVFTDGTVAPFEHAMRSAAPEASEFFWNKLSRPYPGAARLERPFFEEHGDVFTEYCQIVFQGRVDQEAAAWKKRHNKALKKKLCDVRGDTFFSLILKMTIDMTGRDLPEPPAGTIPISFEEMKARLRHGVLTLAQIMDRKALEDTDFKLQSPLMLAAVNADVDLVKALLDRQVDVTAADSLGRTALHSAALGHSTRCFELILSSGADVMARTCVGTSAFALAANLGEDEMVRLCLEKSGSNIPKTEREKVLACAIDCYENYKRRRKDFAQSGKKIAPKARYRRVADLLSGEMASSC